MIGRDQPHEELRVVDGRDAACHLAQAGLLDLSIGVHPIACGHRGGCSAGEHRTDKRTAAEDDILGLGQSDVGVGHPPE